MATPTKFRRGWDPDIYIRNLWWSATLTARHSIITPLLPHDLVAMCYYRPIVFECPACRNVVSRGGEDRECKDYIQTRDREMARMQKWREGSRERAPPTPFIFGWCQKYGKTEKNQVTVVSEMACELCLDAGWSGENNHPSPSDSEASTSLMHNRWLSPEVRAPLTPLTSIEDELDNDKMELDFPVQDTPANSKGRPVRQSERIRAREEKKAGLAAAQNRTTEPEMRGRPTSARRKQ
ncbi:hypothetical protein BDM02DRAFT_3109301 [Thelephora ganbajun]|uniref:Uncharacterized protein n=1 Tax=Thelephora ganbajun TaxID=370292 RepID=A0ACB6ZT50_THEGA|nr:hypothetical protein BDM02DRAFT_3109301 [Thelephora ganbajun]